MIDNTGLCNRLCAGIGDTVCLVDIKTQLPISAEFVVLGIAHRPGPDNSMKKYLYLSDGDCAHNSDKVRVVNHPVVSLETSEEGTINE